MIKTMDGPIPNLDYHGIECPVKLATERRSTSRGDFNAVKMAYKSARHHGTPPDYLPTPLRSLSGTLIYALPGGGQIDSGKI